MGAVSNLFGLSVPHGKLQECIARLEEGLRAINETPYHAIIGRDYLHHLDEASRFITRFYRTSSKSGPLGAMYFEMNGFSINPDRWYFNGFGYRQGGDIWDLTWDTEWLSPWDTETEDFVLTGMEPVQSAFSKLYCDKGQALSIELAGEIAEHLVVARFNELIGAAHDEAKDICPELEGIPVLSTAHDWDCLFPSQ